MNSEKLGLNGFGSHSDFNGSHFLLFAIHLRLDRNDSISVG